MKAAIILSGGTGKRLGEDIPKQYIKVKNRMVIEYCLDRFFGTGEKAPVSALIIVATDEWRNELLRIVGERQEFKGFSDPGETRQLSILNGLRTLKGICSDDDPVMIHDAARPMVKTSFIRECFDAIGGHDGVMPVLPMKDTVYLSHDGNKVDSLLDRSEIFAGQAPEVFRFGKYLKACEDLLPDEILKINGSTEPAIKAGMDIAMIPGDEGNFKITTKADLERFCEIISG